MADMTLQDALAHARKTGDWRPYARAVAKQAGVDPAIFERQIGVESAGWAPDVISGKRKSSAGATGIAQIMPQYHPGVNPLDPKASLDYAAKLMRSHLDTYGRYDLALVAYNGGGGAVQKYQTGQPYDESQRYVKAILGSERPTATKQEGGPTVPTPATPTTPTIPPTEQATSRYDKNILDTQAKVDKIDARQSALTGRQQELFTAMRGLEYGDREYDRLALEVSAIQKEQTLLQQQRNTAEKDLQYWQKEKADAKVLSDNLFKNAISYLSQEISAGQLSRATAQDQFNRLAQAASTGKDGIIQAYSLLAGNAARMGDRKLANAVVGSLKNWQTLGVMDVPDFELPIIPFNPREDVEGYLPPKEAVQQGWQAALSAGPPEQPDFSGLWQNAMNAAGLGQVSSAPDAAPEAAPTPPRTAGRFPSVPPFESAETPYSLPPFDSQGGGLPSSQGAPGGGYDSLGTADAFRRVRQEMTDDERDREYKRKAAEINSDPSLTQFERLQKLQKLEEQLLGY